jgi:hypothetical protein
MLIDFVKAPNGCKAASSGSEICTLVNLVRPTNGYNEVSSTSMVCMLANMVRLVREPIPD